jgi:hypothetical protein
LHQVGKNGEIASPGAPESAPAETPLYPPRKPRMPEMAPVTEAELAAREEPAAEVIVVSKPKPKTVNGEAAKANPRDLLRRALAGMAEPETPQS